MPVPSVTTQNQILDAWLGPDRAAGTEAAYDLELWAGDPRNVGSLEVSGGGYAAVSVDSDDWGPASGGRTSTTTAVQFPTATDAYDRSASHYALRDTTTGDIAFCAPLGEVLTVTGPRDPGPRITPIVFIPTP